MTMQIRSRVIPRSFPVARRRFLSASESVCVRGDDLSSSLRGEGLSDIIWAGLDADDEAILGLRNKDCFVVGLSPRHFTIRAPPPRNDDFMRLMQDLSEAQRFLCRV